MDARRGLHQSLDQIRDDIVRLGGMVSEAIAAGTQALLDGDLTAAAALIEGDDVLDDLTCAIEEHVYQLFALQQPILSGDLRVLITALRMTAEIERSGDLMSNVAKAVRRIHGVGVAPKVRGLIEHMGELSQRLFRHAIDAYVEGDAALASALDDMDAELDDLHREFIQSIFENHPTNTAELKACVQLALVGRYYERIGDHAVNIGEWVHYLITGSMHESPPAPAATP